MHVKYCSTNWSDISLLSPEPIHTVRAPCSAIFFRPPTWREDRPLSCRVCSLRHEQKSMSSGPECVKAVVRCRPLSQGEKDNKEACIVEVAPRQILLRTVRSVTLAFCDPGSSPTVPREPLHLTTPLGWMFVVYCCRLFKIAM